MNLSALQLHLTGSSFTINGNVQIRYVIIENKRFSQFLIQGLCSRSVLGVKVLDTCNLNTFYKALDACG